MVTLVLTVGYIIKKYDYKTDSIFGNILELIFDELFFSYSFLKSSKKDLFSLTLLNILLHIDFVFIYGLYKSESIKFTSERLYS